MPGLPGKGVNQWNGMTPNTSKCSGWCYDKAYYLTAHLGYRSPADGAGHLPEKSRRLDAGPAGG